MKIVVSFVALASALALGGCGGAGGGFNPHAYRYVESTPFLGLGDYGRFSIVPADIPGYGRIVGKSDGFLSGRYAIGHEPLDELACRRYQVCSGIDPEPIRRYRWRRY